MSAPQSNPVITDVFVEGARKGWSIATSSTLPNVVMAFIIIKALEITGALKGLGMILAPAIYLMGSQEQYLGRILGVIGTRARRIPLMIAISVINAFLAMLLMRIIL
ncbi:TPA: hypothetical protein ROG05_004001 [Enterobacter soli]|nr:hypothetical protein [Enterobacter soli]